MIKPERTAKDDARVGAFFGAVPGATGFIASSHQLGYLGATLLLLLGLAIGGTVGFLFGLVKYRHR